MPASMMRPPSGGRLKVIGSSTAMVATGPRPGSTPIMVPRSAPRKQKLRFAGDSATLNPSSRFWAVSMAALPNLCRPDGQIESEAPGEDHGHHGRQQRRKDDHLDQLDLR